MKKVLHATLLMVVLTLANRFDCISQDIDYYDLAYSKIVSMLEENDPSFKEAVFTVENACFDNKLDLAYYDQKIEKYAAFCKEIRQSGNISYDGNDRDKALMQYAVFAFMTEKIPILHNGQIDTVYPFRYHYADFAGKTDWSNMFVSTLMQTKQGNCHSLSYLYKIIMDELGEESYLSLCPNHVYIKARNEKMGWYNIELTNSNFPTDGYLMSSLYIHLDAIRNGMYMKALTRQESIALCLIDLAQGYMAKYGVGDGEFILKCCETALHYFPDCIISLLLQSQIVSEIYQKAEIKTDTELAGLTELAIKIHKLGYRKMPERMYQNWLSNMKSEGRDNFYGSEKINPMATQTNEHSPFLQYGYDKPIVFTASRGMFEEFHDFLDTVEIGNILFDCRKNIIIGFIPEDKIEVRADILPLSVDPHADRYWWITPYAYCNNNPIRIIDPDGRDIIEVDNMGRTIIIKQEGNDILKSTRYPNRQQELSGNGVFEAAYSVKKDENGNLTETRLTGMSGADAAATFGFLADNTDVEWGYMKIADGNGHSSFLVGSAHDPDGESLVFNEALNAAPGSVKVYNHSHPNNGFSSGDPSTEKTSANSNKYSDISAWKDLIKRHTKINMGIRFNRESKLWIDSGLPKPGFINKFYQSR